MPCLRYVFLLMLLIAPSALGQQPTVTAERYPYGSDQIQDQERWLTGRVVDGVTGLPIVGAELLLMDESLNPIRGEFAYEMRAMSDADGFIRIRADKQAPGYQRWHWVCVRAEGYGPCMEMGALDDAIVRLAPSVTVPIEVLDWLDRPVSDALVGFCCGCGHTCDLVSGRTNEKGVVMLRGMNMHNRIADFYVEHPDLGIGYERVSWWPGQWPARLRVGVGVSASGVVVDASNKPIANAYVGQKEFHRGPWTRTAVDGSFHLHGCSAPQELWVQIGSRELRFDRPKTVPFRLQVPADVVEGVQIVNLPRGEKHDSDQPASAASQPSTIVRCVNLPAGCEVKLRTQHSEQDIEDAVHDRLPVPLPSEPFAFVLSNDDGVKRVFAIDRQRARAIAGGVIELPWFRPTMVKGRVVNANREPIDVQIAIVPPADEYSIDESTDWQLMSGSIALATECEAQQLLLIKDNDGSRPMRMVPVMLPRRGDDVSVDIGTIVMADEPQLTLLQPNLQKISNGSVTLLRTGWHDMASGFTYPIEDGRFWLPDLQAGDALLVRSEDGATPSRDGVEVLSLPSRFVLEGMGPWRLRQNGGALLMTITTESKVAEAAAVIGDQLLDLRGPTIVRGLAPGKHKVFLSAEGHQTAIAEVIVPNSGAGELSLTLPKR